MENMETQYSSLEELIPVHFKDNPAPYYIAGILREAIARGILPEGEQLHQSQLAERLKVSPIPLREALRLLERDGLVDFQGRRGAIVTRLDTPDICEIFEMITALELLLMRRALPLISDATLDAASAVLDKMEAEDDRAKWREYNAEFHRMIYEAANRRIITERICRMRHQVDRYIREYLHLMRETSEQQHREMLNALRMRDEAAAVALLTAHMDSASGMLAEYMEKNRKYDK